MKALLLIDGMDIGGAETHVLTLITALKEKGIDASLMCAGGVYAKTALDRGIPVLYAPFKGRDPKSIRLSIRALRRVKSEGFTVIHAHTRYTAALASLCLPKIPLVTSVHLNFRVTPLWRLLCRWGRRSLAVSEDLKEYLVKEYRVKESNVALTVNGIDPLLFPALPTLGKDILHVSRLDKDRSLCALLLCEIAPKLHAYAPYVKIRIYGDGDDAWRVKDAAKRANEKAGTTVVRLLGACDHIQTQMQYGAMLIGVSRAALEGGCSALPIILAGNDGYGGILTKELFEKERNDNFCCRNGRIPKADTLYQDILYLLNQKSLCERIRQKIALLIRAEYTPRRMAEDAISAYYGALRIGAVGYYGFGNFGDEMMLKAMQAGLRARGVHHFYPLQKSKKSILSRARPIRTVFALKKCDLVLFGGGNLFQNETSMRSLLYYSALSLLCKKGARIGACMGIGALHGRLATKICKHSLGGFSQLFLRSEADTQTAKKLLSPTMAARIHTAADLCFCLPEAPKIPPPKNKILIIPSARLGSAPISFFRGLQENGASLSIAVLFPTADLKCAEDIARVLGISSVQAIQSEEDFFDCIGDARLCISMRLHGAIFSLLSHTPCLLSAHSEKNKAFIKGVRLAADECGSPTPILPFLPDEDALQKEKEAAGKTYGFSEIISFFRNRLDY